MKNDREKPAANQNAISQKSQKIYRQTVGQPIRQIKPLVRKIGRNMDIARSKSVSHFTNHNLTSAKKPLVNMPAKVAKNQLDIAPKRHPMAARADELATKKNDHIIQKPTEKTSKEIKEQMIAEAFNKLSNQQKQERIASKHRYKTINIVILSLLLVLVVAYFIFISMPVISVNIASAQAGISATYPEYCPDGYSINGPVTYSDNAVTVRFKANAGTRKFTITQTKSSWDSSAVKNKVSADSKGKFSTTAENGLTIYTYDGLATWVNGGILYTISGNAMLSNSQIRHIATSL